MPPRETTITAAIVKAAKERGWWTFKIAGGGFQRPGMPDLLLVKNGLAVFIEVKVPGEEPRPLQVHVMNEIRTVGGAVVGWATSVDEALEILLTVEPK